jgi:putative phage-type endonuclease
MSAVHLGAHEPGSEEWDNVRRFRLGGSEVAAVLGLSTWESRFSLFMRKKGLLGPQPDNPLMKWGRLLEPVIHGEFVKDHPGDWIANPGMYASPDRRWQIANPDALAADDLAEHKYIPHVNQQEWGEPGTDEIPVRYRCQVLQYLDVHGLGGIWLAALLGGADFRVYRIEWDQDDIDILREEGERFVTDLINDRMPDIDRHSATYQAVRELHPNIVPGSVEVDPELAGDYLAAVIAEKEAKADKEFHGARILDQLGDLRDALVDGARFAYRTHRSRDGQPGTPFLATDRKRLDQIVYPKTIREAIRA